MKPIALCLALVLGGCQSYSVPEPAQRPTPSLVIQFAEESPAFNNFEPVQKSVAHSNEVLLVSVANKSRSAISSERVFSVADTLTDKTVYTAFRFSHLKNDLEYVEVYGLEGRSVEETLHLVKTEGVGKLNGKVYKESQYRRFAGEVDEREFALSGFVSLPEQLAGLTSEFGWQLQDGGAFVNPEGAVVLAKNIQMSVVTVDKHTATEDEINSILAYWKSLYPALSNYQFQINKRKKIITYTRGDV